jgi:Tol biopolymer transport system component
LSWHRLTFENGTVLSAGFAAGGESVIYSAAWKAAPPAVYSTRIDFSESRVLVPPPSKLLSVSKSGEMAVLLRAKPLGWFVMEGTLARVPADGGAPRELLEKIMDAAWSPDGSQLVIVRAAGERVRLEFPPGRVLHETAGHITYPRFSPTGDRIAFVEHPAKLDNWGWIAVVDLEGRRTVWSPVYEMIEGLVWSPSGKELWYGAEGVRGAIQLFASGADRKTRLLASAPGDLAPLAIDAGGRMLANRLSLRAQIACAPPGDARPHDLAYLGASLLADLSPDGRRILFSYRGPGAQTTGAQTNWDVFLRPTAGGSFVRLGAAAAKALSPDGRWAAGTQWSNVFYGVPSPPGSAGESGTSIVLLPTGAGEPRRIGMKQEAIIRAIAFHPDGRRLVLSAAVPPGQSPEQLWVMEISENPVLHSISPPGFYAVTSGFLSPDGRLAAATDPEERLWLVPVEGGEPRRIPGIEEGEKFAGWTGDGKAVYVYRYTDRVTLHRIEIASGARRPWKEASLPDAAGAQEPYAVIVASGAEAWAAGYQSLLGELYLVEGLK